MTSAQPSVQPPAIVHYHQALPAGFVTAGQYTFASQAEAPTAVVFQETLSVGSDITVQTNVAPGTLLSASKNQTLTWTGGSANAIVRVTLIDDINQIASPKDVWYASASAGYINLSYCTGGVGGLPLVCSYGLPPGSHNAELIVDVLPPNGVAVMANALGISEQVRFSWVYSHVFAGLSISD